MVLLAAGFYAGLALFIHWNALSAVADGYGTPQPGIVDMLIPALRDAGIYLAIATGIYLVKRLFVRPQSRQLSNID
jgi:hypothetical protein